MELNFDIDAHMNNAVARYEDIARRCNDELHHIKNGWSPFPECEGKTEFKYFTVLKNRSVTARTRVMDMRSLPKRTPQFWEAYRAWIVAAERVHDFICQMSFICDAAIRVPKTLPWESKDGYASLLLWVDTREQRETKEREDAAKARQQKERKEKGKAREREEAAKARERKEAADARDREEAEEAARAFEAESAQRAHMDSAKVVLKSLAHGTYVHADGDVVTHREEPSFWREIILPDGSVLLQPWDSHAYLSKRVNGVRMSKNMSSSCKWTIEGKFIKVADQGLYLSATDAGSVALQPHKLSWAEISMMYVDE
jgi:hypothetical protein